MVAAHLVDHVFPEDDYGEVWVNGLLPRGLKGPNQHVIGGCNSMMPVPLSNSV